VAGVGVSCAEEMLWLWPSAHGGLVLVYLLIAVDFMRTFFFHFCNLFLLNNIP
jgi:hypothetical protein